MTNQHGNEGRAGSQEPARSVSGDVHESLRALIRTIPDFPAPGVRFRDITTLLLDGRGLRDAVELMAAGVAEPPDLVAGIEARGFIFGAALAHRLGCGLLLLRKRSKLPGATIGVNYALEYGSDRIEMHVDACRPGARVLLVDDLIATGGTAHAGVQLLRQAGAAVIGASFVVDLPDLGGAERLRDVGVATHALLAYPGH